MPAKKIAPPIDRPLSKAYLRNFLGLSTAYPPGQSDPNSLRVMENMLVDRNGALGVRPGLKYLSYSTPPDQDTSVEGTPGIAYDLPPVGSQEPFYVLNGDKALLYAVRELDDTVGFRAILFSGSTTTVHGLEDPEIGFEIPQGAAALNFTARTQHVEYLQIDNRIIAMSDADEPIRIFYVGDLKLAKRLNSISVPEWKEDHKLSVVHPEAAWINKQTSTTRRNVCLNPSFEIGPGYWTYSGLCSAKVVPSGFARAGARLLELRSLPTRTNAVNSPLHDVAGAGIGSWWGSPTWGKPRLIVDGSWMKVNDAKGKGTFMAYSSKMLTGITAGQRYKVAFDYELGAHVTPKVRVRFYSSSGSAVGNPFWLTPDEKDGRYVSGRLLAPTGAVAARVWIGGKNKRSSATFVRVKNVVFCRDNESTDMFHGSSGTNYFWTGTANYSASVHHPPVDVTMTSSRGPARPSTSMTGVIETFCTVSKTWTLGIRSFDRAAAEVGWTTDTGSTGASTWTRPDVTAALTAAAITAELELKIASLARGEVVSVDAAMLEEAGAASTYFDGSTAHTTTTANSWEHANSPHSSISVQKVLIDPFATPTAETPTANTLVASGGAGSNPYKVGFFITFSNDVGESAPSKVTEVRTMRPWSNWRWETANANGEPSGTATDNEKLCADQLVAILPQAIYDQAIAEGAIQWNLYAMTWSDQEPVPVEAARVAEQDLYPDSTSSGGDPLPYAEGGWIEVTPARRFTLYTSPLPSATNRVNHSDPPRSRQGLVAGDRLILVGDAENLAVIKWSSNQFGEYTNFTPYLGGGEKTLASGNLNIPARVVLWQNPQSVDTITILCMGGDGMSNSYYMSPGAVQGSSGIAAVMGFEETTSTPGTLSPYAGEVINNALYRPTNQALLKSTANNYNINHKTMSDKIDNMWKRLRTKHLIATAHLDNRLYLLVHNTDGEVLEQNAKGNEVWVYDLGIEAGVWSRFLVQGSALRPFDVGSYTYMGVCREDGVYYFDPQARVDEYVADGGEVLERPIPWQFETNTQGANRAHDAWAHLQQVGITLGNFLGTMEYGIRGVDLNGMWVDVHKQVSDLGEYPEDGSSWNIEDPLLVRRDMKEWHLYARSVEGLESSGHVGYVQYRYTPVTVNVGYEFGSVETFEYRANEESGANVYSDNGVPLPYMDMRRL